jgi:CRISPR-associated protein Csy1
VNFEEAFSSARGHHQRGEFAQAIEDYRRALEAKPDHPETWHLKGLAEHQSGRLDAALESAGRAIALGGHRAPFLLFQGELLHDRGRVREALDAFWGATRDDPLNSRAWNNLGVALAELGRFQEAEASFARAVSLDGRYAMARLNLARMYDGRDSAKGIEQVEAALQIDPRMVDAWLLLGDLHRRRFALEHALAALESGISVAPGNARVVAAYADVLSHMGRVDESRRAFQQAAAIEPSSLKAALGANLLLPRVYQGVEHVAQSREAFERGLETLHDRADSFRFVSPEAALADARWANFYLPYQGGDDRPLQSRYGDFLRRVLAPRLPRFYERGERRREGRIRVGFLSHFFYNSVVSRYFGSWITDLDRDVFEVFVYYTNETMADDTKRIASRAEAFRHLAGRPLHWIATQVLEDKLDVLVYPELGMHPETVALAALRLAPVQCASWGHPVTSGLPEIDWFVSSQEMEPDDAQSHYREQLALVPGFGTRYERPAGAGPGSRGDFGIPEDRHAYFVPQSLFKIHPDNDALFARVLERDPRGVLVLFPSSREELTRAFKERLGSAFAERGLDFDARTVFLRFVPHATYLRINELCDVMLDTLHWSGGNTGLDALASGLPLVTLPGRFMRGRQSAAMLRLLGTEELIAANSDEYVEKAVAIGTTRDCRDELSRRIVAGHGALFDRSEGVAGFARFLEQVARGR